MCSLNKHRLLFNTFLQILGKSLLLFLCWVIRCWNEFLLLLLFMCVCSRSHSFLKVLFLSCRQLASKTTTYYYHFDHLGSVSLADLMIDKLLLLKKMIGYHSTNGLGVCHGDEIFHLFRFVSLWKCSNFFFFCSKSHKNKLKTRRAM